MTRRSAWCDEQFWPDASLSMMSHCFACLKSSVWLLNSPWRGCETCDFCGLFHLAQQHQRWFVPVAFWELSLEKRWHHRVWSGRVAVGDSLKATPPPLPKTAHQLLATLLYLAWLFKRRHLFLCRRVIKCLVWVARRIVGGGPPLKFPAASSCSSSLPPPTCIRPFKPPASQADFARGAGHFVVVEMTVYRTSPFPFFPPSVENTEAVATLTTPFLEPGGQNENRFLLVEVED